MLTLSRRFVPACLLAAATVASPVSPARASVAADVRTDADWLMQAVAADGGIGTWIDKAWLVPYRSNFAAMGLARATAITGDPRYATAAWNWLVWYQQHMDVSGFVTDYQWRNGAWRSTGDMDSTDAYAATFLMAAREALRATGDLTRLSSLRAGLSKAVGAIAATAAGDGLHYAKPTWLFKYAMDEAENYAGLRAAAELASLLGDASLASRASNDAARLKAAFPKFWNPSAHGYDWAIHANGTRATLNWAELYPSAVAQAWAIAFGLVEGSAAADLFARFDAAQPWDTPTATTMYPWGAGRVDYWPVGGLAAARAGNPARARAAAASIRSAALAANRFWPFTTAEAGELILLQTDGLDRPAPLIPIATTMTASAKLAVSGVSSIATLRESAGGYGIAGASIDFYALDPFTRRRGARICTATTDGAGTARCPTGTSAVAGGFEAVFAGTPLHRASTARAGAPTL